MGMMIARVAGRLGAAVCLVGLLVWYLGEDRSVLASAQRGGDLRTLTKTDGAVTVSVPYVVDVPPFSLNELSRLSPHIFVGRAVSNVSRLTSEGRSVETVFNVQVLDVLKGDLSIGEMVQIAVPGGRYGFPDGTFAQVNVIGFRRPRNGYRYLWFAQREDTRGERLGRASFVPMFGPLGMYELPDREDVFVYPSGMPTSRFAITVIRLQMNADMFVERVRASSKH